MNEIDFDDLEEDDTEENEVMDDAKINSNFQSLDFTNYPLLKSNSNTHDSKLIAMFRNIQCPPPKI